MCALRDLGVDVPLRNDHDVANSDGKSVFAFMSDSAKQAIKSTVDDEDENSYSDLSAYSFTQWAYDPYNFSRGSFHTWNTEMSGYETDEENPIWKGGNNDVWLCKFCAKLDMESRYVHHGGVSSLGRHLKKM